MLSGATTDNLERYSSFEKIASDTFINLTSTGAGSVDHVIKLAYMDLIIAGNNSNIIDDLL